MQPIRQRVSPADLSKIETRQFGLGAAPSSGSAEASWKHALSCPLTNLPVIEYVTLTMSLPLLDTQLAQTFGAEVQVLNQQGTPPGVVTVDSSFAVNGILNTNMLACGIGVHAFGEPFSFSTIGTAIPSSSTALPVSPDVFSNNDLIHNALSSATTGIFPAALEWGFATWNAIWHMANAYQFQMILCGRYLVLKELMSDVAYYGPYAAGSGMSNSDVVAQQYFAQVNGLGFGNQSPYKAAGQYIVPVNYRRTGSVNANATAGLGPVVATNTGIFHPVRDYDLVPLTFGGLTGQQQNANNPFRRFTKPIFFPAGVPIQMVLFVQDNYHFQQMTRYMSISEGAGNNSVAQVSVIPGVTGVNVPGATTAGLELTVDQGANNFAAQTVNMDRYLFKGGTQKISMLLKGFEIGAGWMKEWFGSSDTATQNTLSAQVWFPGRGEDARLTPGQRAL